MRNSWAGKLLVGAAALVVLIGIVLHFSNRNPPPVTNTPPAVSQKRESAASRNFSSRSQASTPAQESPIQPDDQLAQFLALKLPREKIEEYLTLHHRDAASLLAAFHASGDTNNPTGDINYLKEAAANFPNDPYVQLTVVLNVFPEERRKWLDAFKASSPDNSLANYLSAMDHFKNGHPDAAINELLAASRKSRFENFAMESCLSTEELYRSSGKSPLEASRAAMSAMHGDYYAQVLPAFKGLAWDLVALQKQYLSAGDTASAENLSQMGVVLGNQLNSGESGKLIINQLVGLAIENIALQQLDQNTTYDFLSGKTPAQRKEELKQQRVMFKELGQSFESIHPTMTEAETVSYFERLKIYGEVEALRWVQQQHKSDAPPKGN